MSSLAVLYVGPATRGERVAAADGTPTLAVETVADPSAAASQLSSADADCVVVAESDPGATRRLRAARPDVPVVVDLGAPTATTHDRTAAGAVGSATAMGGLTSVDDAVAATLSAGAAEVARGGPRAVAARVRSAAAADGVTEAVFDAATTLTDAATDEVATKVAWTLDAVRSALGVDRAAGYLRDGDGFAPEHVAANGEGWPPPDPADLGYGEEPLATLECFGNARIGGVDAHPDAETTCGPPDASAVAVPIVRAWSLAGFFVFEATDGRAWSETDVDRCRTFADIVGATLDRRDHERDLRRQNERLEQFTEVVSHDLRNPINVAAGYVDLARQTGDDDHLDRVANAVERMDELVDGVLALAERGEAIGDVDPVSLAAAVDDAWASIDADAVAFSRDDNLGTATADEGRLVAVLENLLGNAVDHGGGAVHVGRLGDREGFYVADDGPGIPPERRERIFEHGHTSSEDGTGVGLSIVETIVKAHDWSVGAVESDGGGARFEVVTG